MAAATIALCLGAVPLAAAPAQAAESGTTPPCTVIAERPYHNGEHTVSNKPVVVYPISVFCWETGAKVHLRQQLMESDTWPNGDDVQRGWFDPVGGPLNSKIGAQSVNTKFRLTDMDDIGKSEVYHKVEFWVTNSRGVNSPKITVTSRERSIQP